jgi:hypothetical protein
MFDSASRSFLARLPRAPGWLGVLALLLVAFHALTPARASNPQESGSALALSPPTNIACLPFAQPTITEFNGNEVSGPYTSDATQTFITWRDESDSEDSYHVDRRVGNGNWVTIATLPAGSTNYTDTGLQEHDNYFYRVGALEGASFGGWSDICRKPAFLDSSGGNFRVFYRPHFPNCPEVENLDGASDTMCSDQSTAQRMADILELSYAWTLEYGFPDPVTNPPYPVDLTLCDGRGCVRSNGGTSFMALKPASMATPFDLATATNQHALRVPRHELFHVAQQGVKFGGDSKWGIEGTARSTDDKHCLDRPACTLTLDTFPGSVTFNESGSFLANPNRTLFETSYQATLFWTYISEQYGKLNQEPERGIDFFAQLWISGQANAHDHGRQVIDFALADMGYSDTFVDVFKNFVVANYAKDLPNALAKYRYIDESQPPGSYGPVALTANLPLNVGQAYVVPGELGAVAAWGARYFRFTPDPAVPTIEVRGKPLANNNQLYFTLLAVKNGSIVQEVNYTGSNFVAAMPNAAFDEVVVVVAGLNNSSNFTLTVNATSPILRVVNPITGRAAQAGDPTTPEKILIQVEVLAPEGGGTPIAGLDPTSFEIAVGGVMVPANQLITSAYIQGEYWLLVRAPAQPAIGFYPLTVTNNSVVGGASLSDTQPNAVQYGAAIESDNLIVADRSGSMLDFDKLTAAKDAARIYVDSWEEGDQIGVVSYHHEATLDLPLQAWTSTSRTAAFNAINAWIANGATGIGRALLEGLAAFDAAGDPAHPWNMLLLTDGMETESNPNLQDFIDEYSSRVSDGDQVPTIHVVALGADADQAAMQNLTNSTAGTYHFAAAPENLLHGGADPGALNNELAEIYRVVGETIALEQQIYAVRDFLPVGLDIHTHQIRVDGSAREAVFAINWVQTGNPTPVTVQLRRPDNVLVTDRLIDPNHYLYRVPLPMQGIWTVRIAYAPPGLLGEPSDIEGGDGGFSYLVEAALRSDLTMDLFLGLAPEERLTGRPMPLLVSLSDTQPLTGATVIARVTTPSGATHNATLHDDGAHGDGAAGDGFYGGTFFYTSQPGSYRVVADADGVSPLHGTYTRRLRTSFYMDGGKDSDGDGLPDHWEEDKGLDPLVPDPTFLDHDGDGLLTFLEFQIGTHPLDPDTDNGGENDGSEYFRGARPQDDPTDDGILPPDVTPWPGAGQLWLTLTRGDGYTALRVLRSVGPAGPWEVVADNVRPSTQWHDPQLSNGTEYCYRVIALGARGIASGSTNITCGTPKLDPIAPEGYVAIEDDAPSTRSLNVRLSLGATDATGDAHIDHDDDDHPPYTEGTRASGVGEMMISNRADFAGATWERYQTSRSWTLEPNGNLATVYVRFRDRAGNISESAADSILVDTDQPPPPVYLPVISR